MSYKYGSKRLELRRPPLIVSGTQVLGGLVILLLAVLAIAQNYGLLTDSYEFIQDTVDADLIDVEQLLTVAHYAALALFAVIVIPAVLASIVTGSKYVLMGLSEIVTPWMPANIPEGFRDYAELVNGFKERSLSIYQAMPSFVTGLFGPNTMFLAPTRRDIVQENASKLRGRLVGLIIAAGALGCSAIFSNWLKAELGTGGLTDSEAETIELLIDRRALELLRLPFLWLLARQVGFGVVEWLTTAILVPRRQPSTVSDEASEHYRGYGHPAHLFSRLPDISQELQWDDFANRSHTEWDESPTISVSDVGEFEGYILIERQPEPIETRGGLAAYMLLIVGWLFSIAGYVIFLFLLLPAQARRLRIPADAPMIYAPIAVFVLGYVAFGIARAGGRFVRQARTLFEATRFASPAILIDVAGSLSREGVKIGKSIADSVESSSVVARSDFTARFWAAELISEAARLDSPRDLLALNRTIDSQQWIDFFPSAIHDLRDEGVRPFGVDLEAPEIERIVQANVNGSALHAGAMERAQLYAGQTGREVPMLASAVDHEPDKESDGPAAPYLPPPPIVAGSEYKECPDCAELVRFRARKCRFCGYRFDSEAD